MADSLTFLVYGATGWIGGMVEKLLTQQGHHVVKGLSRLEHRVSLTAEISAVKPDRVINCAGLTGRPNVDWCEDHKAEVIRVNIIGVLNLADVCQTYQIHLTNLATGCIYEYDENHPLGSGMGFTELDDPNFVGSFYSYTKAAVENILHSRDVYPNILTLRLRMPISDDLHERSFVTKITKYAKVVNIPNSMSVLHDLVPILTDMSLTAKTGIYNFVNPGTISHNEILDLYIKYIDPNFTYTNFTLKEQAEVIKAPRSNNQLNADKLLDEYPDLPHIKESIVTVFERMKINLTLSN